MQSIIINNNYNSRRAYGDSKIKRSQEIFAEAIRKTNPDAKIQGKIADIELDTKKSTDLVFRIDGQEYYSGLRNRKSDCTCRDFTIRRSYYGSTNSEAKKIHNTDFYIYTWGDDCEEYVVINMNKVKENNLIKKYKNSQYIPNVDDGNHFFSIPLNELYYKGCIIAYSESLEPYMNGYDESDDMWD